MGFVFTSPPRLSVSKSNRRWQAEDSGAAPFPTSHQYIKPASSIPKHPEQLNRSRYPTVSLSLSLFLLGRLLSDHTHNHNPKHIMLPRLLPLFTFLTLAICSTITFELKPDEDLCYYVFTETRKQTIDYYFAVQSGGSFDVDYTITGPGNKLIAEEHKQRQGDWHFIADDIGEYEFCFSNKMSTYAHKVVDFEISMENEFSASLPVGEAENVRVDGIVNSVEKIDNQLNDILKSLQHYKTRNKRNEATVKSTESRIFHFSVCEVLLCVLMAAVQVGVVHFYFKSSRKQLV